MKIQKNAIYNDNLLQYKDFLLYSEYLLNYIRNKSNDKKFKIKCIIQSNNEVGYDFIKIKKFMEYYQSMKNKLI